jgi:thiopurine S-methyltransferase
MESNFWIERWQQGQIGFHQDQINNYLLQHWPALKAEKGATVFVPLCGKSLDMLWLANQGYQVIGIELSDLAVQAFFEENKIKFNKTGQDNFTIYSSDSVTIYCGDFFDLATEHMADVQYIYDRATLIALPPDMRKDYVAKLASILPSQVKSLLITMEYPQHEMDGPPFSVTEEEVYDLFQSEFETQVLGEIDVLEQNARFKERGLTAMKEKSFQLVKK